MQEEKVPKAMKERYEEIVALTDKVCNAHLTEEYAMLCRKLAAALARKRPSPLASGRVKSWACGIAYAIGRVNFLSDPSQTPHMKLSDLCGLFGISQSTGGSKSGQIFDLMDMMPLDPRWSLPSQLDNNPMAWFVMVNGMIVDARRLPRHLQEEAFEKGIIPYIPGDKESGT